MQNRHFFISTATRLNKFDISNQNRISYLAVNAQITYVTNSTCCKQKQNF